MQVYDGVARPKQPAVIYIWPSHRLRGLRHRTLGAGAASVRTRTGWCDISASLGRTMILGVRSRSEVGRTCIPIHMVVRLQPVVCVAEQMVVVIRTVLSNCESSRSEVHIEDEVAAQSGKSRPP